MKLQGNMIFTSNQNLLSPYLFITYDLTHHLMYPARYLTGKNKHCDVFFLHLSFCALLLLLFTNNTMAAAAAKSGQLRAVSQVLVLCRRGRTVAKAASGARRCCSPVSSVWRRSKPAHATYTNQVAKVVQGTKLMEGAGVQICRTVSRPAFAAPG